MSSTSYRGRFAPSPTGPLHFGSLATAVGSYLEARTHGGEWLVRMEDLDKPREQPGADDDILRALESHGMTWDGAVMYQSRRHEAYEEALSRLKAMGVAYPCACSRKEISDSATLGVEGPVYPGTCRHGLNGKQVRAWRLCTTNEMICFEDLLQGTQCQVLERDIGDFVLKRADGFFAYQLAVVVDDAEQNITHVVRGADLIDSTPRQIWLQRQLGLARPVYAHLPVVINEHGEKLSKQTLAKPLDMQEPARNVMNALRFLGHHPPETLCGDIDSLWHWARTSWRLDAVPRSRAIMPAS